VLLHMTAWVRPRFFCRTFSLCIANNFDQHSVGPCAARHWLHLPLFVYTPWVTDHSASTLTSLTASVCAVTQHVYCKARTECNVHCICVKAALRKVV
jgi:hypothetical protein